MVHHLTKIILENEEEVITLSKKLGTIFHTPETKSMHETLDLKCSGQKSTTLINFRMQGMKATFQKKV